MDGIDRHNGHVHHNPYEGVPTELLKDWELSPTTPAVITQLSPNMTLPPGYHTVAASTLPTANQAATIGTTPQGATIGAGSIVMITIMLFVYDMFCGFGLGWMMWKGIIDWKGNINEDQVREASLTDDMIIILACEAHLMVTLNDAADNDFHVPLTFVKTAIRCATTHPNDNGADINNTLFLLTGADGVTSGHMRLGVMVEQTMGTIRSHGLLD